MKARKKPRGMKQRIREERKREERIGLAIIVSVLIALIFISGFIINSLLNQPSTNPTSQTVSSASQPKAAIVDQLSLTYPNQTFIETATSILNQAGYTVDYYPGEKVTVEFYRNLPTRNYGIVILRVHSTATNPDLAEVPVTLFTSERYDDTKYVYEQLTDQLFHVAFSSVEKEKGIIYFGITPLFVTQSMKGELQNTVIIMMGCQGLGNSLMAKAFVEKGAKAYISWNQPVSASHTDAATTYLLRHLVTEKQRIKQAVYDTMSEVGLDPAYNSVLGYYPSGVENQTIENINAEG